MEHKIYKFSSSGQFQGAKTWSEIHKDMNFLNLSEFMDFIFDTNMDYWYLNTKSEIGARWQRIDKSEVPTAISAQLILYM